MVVEWTNPQGEIKHFNTIQGWKISKDDNNVLADPVLTPPSNDLPF